MHIILMGPPGVGKGTAAEYLKVHYDIPHISTGEMFRKAIGEQTKMGLLAKQFMDQGQLVPDDVTNGIVRDRLSLEDCKKGFMLDGYPRTINQAVKLDEMLKDLNIKLDAVVNLFAEYDVLVERITGRRLCSTCGKGYHIKNMPPKVEGICDDCGGKLYQRKDDSLETIKNRLEVYERQTKPLLEYYEKQGNLINIDGANNATETVKAIINSLEELNDHDKK